MDINMPIMDGYAASTEIKNYLRKEELKNNNDYMNIVTKVYAVTAQKEVVNNERGIFDGVILKPVSLGRLREVMHLDG